MTPASVRLVLAALVSASLLLASCATHYASKDPRAQRWPMMTKRLYRGVETGAALRAAGWTLANMGILVRSIDVEEGVVRIERPDLPIETPFIRVTKSGASDVIVEFANLKFNDVRIADPNFFESFFAPLSEQLGVPAELVGPLPT